MVNTNLMGWSTRLRITLTDPPHILIPTSQLPPLCNPLAGHGHGRRDTRQGCSADVGRRDGGLRVSKSFQGRHSQHRGGEFWAMLPQYRTLRKRNTNHLQSNRIPSNHVEIRRMKIAKKTKPGYIARKFEHSFLARNFAMLLSRHSDEYETLFDDRAGSKERRRPDERPDPGGTRVYYIQNKSP